MPHFLDLVQVRGTGGKWLARDHLLLPFTRWQNKLFSSHVRRLVARIGAIATDPRHWRSARVSSGAVLVVTLANIGAVFWRVLGRAAADAMVVPIVGISEGQSCLLPMALRLGKQGHFLSASSFLLRSDVHWYVILADQSYGHRTRAGGHLARLAAALVTAAVHLELDETLLVGAGGADAFALA